MSVRRLLATVTAALLTGAGLAAPAAARDSAQPVAAGVFEFGAGRLGAVTGALPALAGAVVAGLALARPAGRLITAGGRLAAKVATAAAAAGMVLGGLVAATADGGLGTGNGLGGAYVAMLVGLLGTALGGLALVRSRRADRPGRTGTRPGL
ncbi:hypothetical protein FM076_01355 [Streptomyces albus subsp. chlorinus]|uniref:DUF6223 family protein n=1 Tax=Streptomyces albus TaxID=1888 RepID=UPI00156E3FED|nr:DUF6223 family protein [Streptomyces albus]NSC19927.1 hypothetical protein [Streptomyces albus subsp. chlorinus]